MKLTLFLIGLFGTGFTAPNADKIIGSDWAIHPFSVFATLMIVMGAWLLSDVDWL
jgi:hypothetical protein